jgi:hypothetical protein
MPLEIPEERRKCPLCNLEVPESELQECFICHEVFCQFCGMHDYGRTFCSTRCRGFFFWGDGDSTEKDY